MIALFIYTVSLITIIATSTVVVKNVSMLQSMKNENIRYKQILDSQNSSTMSHIQSVIAQQKQNDEKIKRAHLDAQRNVDSVKISNTQQMGNLNQDLNTFRFNDRTYKEKLGDRISEMSNIHTRDIETYTRFAQREIDNRFQTHSNLPHFLHDINYRSTANGSVFTAQDFESINVDMPNDSLWHINNDLSNSLSYISSTFADKLSENASLIESIYSQHRLDVADICGSMTQLNSQINNYQSNLVQTKNELTREVTQKQTDLTSSITSNYNAKYGTFKTNMSNDLGLGKCDAYNTEPFHRAYDLVIRNCAGSIIGDVMTNISNQSYTYTCNIENDITREFETVQSNYNTFSKDVEALDEDIALYSSRTDTSVREKVSYFESNINDLRDINNANQTELSDLLLSTSNFQEKKNIYNDFVSFNTSSAYSTVNSTLNRAKTAVWTADDFCKINAEGSGGNLCLSDVKSQADAMDSNARKVETYSFIGDRGPVISSDARLVFESTNDGTEKASLSYEKQGTTEYNYLDGTVNIIGKLFLQGSEFNLHESRSNLNKIQSNIVDGKYTGRQWFDSKLTLLSSNLHRHSQYASVASVESLNYNYTQWLTQPVTLYQESTMFSTSNISKFGFDNMNISQQNRKVFGAEEGVNSRRIIFQNTDALPNNVFKRGECIVDSIPSSNIQWGTHQVPSQVFRYASNSIPGDSLNQLSPTDAGESSSRNELIRKIKVVGLSRAPTTLTNVNISDVKQGNLNTPTLQVKNVPANQVNFTTSNLLSQNSVSVMNVGDLNIAMNAKTGVNTGISYVYASNIRVEPSQAKQVYFCKATNVKECNPTNIFLTDNPSADIQAVVEGSNVTISFR